METVHDGVYRSTTLVPSRSTIELHRFLFLIMIGSAACWALRFRWRRGWTLLVGVQLLLAIGVQLYTELGSGGNTHALYNVYMALEITLFLAVAACFMDTRRGRMGVLLAWLCVAIVFAIELLQYGTIHLFAATTVVCGGGILVALYALLLLRLVDRTKRTLWRTPEFWVFSGVVLYYAGAAPILGLVHYFNDRDVELSGSLYRINQVLAMVRYAAIGIGLYLITPGHDRW